MPKLKRLLLIAAALMRYLNGWKRMDEVACFPY